MLCSSMQTRQSRSVMSSRGFSVQCFSVCKRTSSEKVIFLVENFVDNGKNYVLSKNWPDHLTSCTHQY